MKRIVSGIMLTLLLVSMLTLVFKNQTVKAEGTIYIRADGSVDPPTAPIQRNGDLYTLTGNVTSDAIGIVIERDNMTLDGTGYTIQGIGDVGIVLSGRSNVTVKNIKITAFNFIGIDLKFSSHCSIIGNNMTNCSCGIQIFMSSNNRIVGNSFANEGLFVTEGSCGNVVEDNIVNGKPLVYFEGVTNYTVADAGQVILINCSNIRVENLNLSSVTVGLQMLGTHNSRIANNNIPTNKLAGIWLDCCSNCSIVANNIANNNIGVELHRFSNNSISGNSITENRNGNIMLFESSNNSISGNNITASNLAGIVLASSSNYNSISGNNIANNDYGIYTCESANYNVVYYNNFINNTNQVYTDILTNIWDNGYPSGGNYWSDFKDSYPEVEDVYRGPYQNETGSDGMWDHPYVIDADNQDRYPLTNPWAPPPIGVCGIDVSHYQGTVNWAEVHNAGYSFAFVKASEGTSEGTRNILAVLDSGTDVEILEHNDDGIFSDGYYWWYLNVTSGVHIGKVGWVAHIGLPSTVKAGDQVKIVQTARLRNSPTVGYDDEKFVENMKNAKKAGILVGAYHFARPDREIRLIGGEYISDAVAEAKHFLSVAGESMKRGYLRPALDIEVEESGKNLTKEELSQWVHEWMSTIEKETSVEPILYTGPYYARQYLNSSVKKYNLWVAHWTYDLTRSPDLAGIWDSWDFWQWSNESKYAPLGYVPGVEGNVDLDVFNGDVGRLYDDFAIGRMKIVGKSPIDLTVTDPEGLAITKDVGEVLGMFYMEHDVSGDGKPDDIVYVWDRKTGDYLITVTPQLNATPTDTYTLEVSAGNMTAVLAENVSISEIPSQPYIVTSNQTTIIPRLDPHDIGITHFTTSKTVIGQNYPLNVNVTIFNYGQFTETFNVTLYANTTTIATFTNIILPSRNSTTITFTWNTAGFAKGNYTIWAYAWPVEGETYKADNTKDDGTVLVSIAGDVNGDHLVDISDLVITVNAIPSAPGWPNWNPNADINSDGVCDISDLVICVGNIPSGPW